MVTYSLDCVTKVVDPLHSNWIWNVKECLAQDIMPVVCEVLRLHAEFGSTFNEVGRRGVLPLS